jgi:hypothetical protein
MLAPPNQMPDDRQGRSDRKRVAIECHVDGVAPGTPLYLADLSVGGGFVDTAASFQRGDRIHVTFTLNGQQVQCLARVAHVRPSVGFGFAFVGELPGPTRLMLERFIDS